MIGVVADALELPEVPGTNRAVVTTTQQHVLGLANGADRVSMSNDGLDAFIGIQIEEAKQIVVGAGHSEVVLLAELENVGLLGESGAVVFELESELRLLLGGLGVEDVHVGGLVAGHEGVLVEPAGTGGHQVLLPHLVGLPVAGQQRLRLLQVVGPQPDAVVAADREQERLEGVHSQVPDGFVRVCLVPSANTEGLIFVGTIRLYLVEGRNLPALDLAVL